MLLILAGISLSGLFSGKGLFKRTEDASSRYNEAKAREVLETMLLTDGQFEKNTNPKYNQDDFLDELIKKEIPGSNVIEDVAIIGGEYAYELDRSVPKIGHYLGNPKDLIWPKVTTTELVLADDYRSASFKITATIDEKATRGITRIEVWLLGEIIKEYKYTDNTKDTRTETFETNRNGEYTIKAYAELMGSNKTTVEGIVPAVEFMPNGRTEWKKQHSTKIILKETAEKVKSLKYKWTNSVKALEVGDFSDAENCNNNDTITGGNDTMTGTYYLWVLLTTESNKTNICGSEGFYFDNEGPTITSLTSNPETENSFILTAIASDTKSGIEKYEFYLDGKKVKTISDSRETIEYKHITSSLAIGKSLVIVYDKAGNTSSLECDYRTRTHTWEKYNCNITRVPEEVITDTTYELCSDTGTNAMPIYVLSRRPTLQKVATSVGIGKCYENYYGTWTKQNYYVNFDGSYELLVSQQSSDDYTGFDYWEIGEPIGWRNSSWRVFKAKYYSCIEHNVPSQGTSYLGLSYSTNINDYPNEGEKDGIWYIYKGIG